MKLPLKGLFLPSILSGFSLLLAGRSEAQTFTTLHTFSAASPPSYLNADGTYPEALVLSGNTLYGTANVGGTAGYGAVFAMNLDGTGFTNLHSFAHVGAGGPGSGLLLSDDTLYGATGYQGISAGTVFKLSTNGADFAVLCETTGAINIYNGPWKGLAVSGNTLYAAEPTGGDFFVGRLFAINIDGTGFTILHAFTQPDPMMPHINSDGFSPTSLLLSGDTLYGLTCCGGSSGDGTVFKLKTDGTGFATLYTFTGGSDASNPAGGLTLSGDRLYGTTESGSSGTVFAINTDGTDFTTLHTFARINIGPNTNSDGAGANGGLILSGNTLYGTTQEGGSGANGTIFAVNTDGSGFVTLHSFTAFNGRPETNSDGAYPLGGLVLSGNTLYGTTEFGGSSGNGTVFSLSLGAGSSPQLTIIPSGPNVILTWPANATGFNLQSTTNFDSSAVWTPISPAPVIVNDQNIVTNSVSGTHQFFRLSQ